MSRIIIAGKLKSSRKNRRLSVQEVVNKLHDIYGIKVAAKTLYGWEANRSQPDIDTFLALCQIYGLSTTDFNELGYRLQGKIPSYIEQTDINTDILKKFLSLPVQQQSYLLDVMKNLCERCD